MDEGWSLIKEDLLLSATSIVTEPLGTFSEVLCSPYGSDIADGAERAIKSEPEETSDYHSSPSSSLSSPGEQLQPNTELYVTVNNFPAGIGFISPQGSSGYAIQHQQSPLPPVSQFSQQGMPARYPPEYQQIHNNNNAEMAQAKGFYYDDNCSSPLSSERSSPVDARPQSARYNGIISVRSRSKMHEMAVKQRLISDQDPRGNGQVQLSAEERRTLQQEGYAVPTRLPLTKAEEEALKIVRRKIKNKLSAQESRRKRKEYLDGLESKVAGMYADNATCKSRLKQLEAHIRALESENRDLRAKLAGRH